MGMNGSEISKIAGYLFMALCLLGALGAVVLPRLRHAAFSLAAALASAGILSFFLHAGFVGILQLLYAAGFTAILLYLLRSTEDKNEGVSLSYKVLTLLGAGLFSALAVKVFQKTPWVMQSNTEGFSFGSLFGNYFFPFTLFLFLALAVFTGIKTISKQDA